jgi:hypothetical protein
VLRSRASRRCARRTPAHETRRCEPRLHRCRRAEQVRVPIWPQSRYLTLQTRLREVTSLPIGSASRARETTQKNARGSPTNPAADWSTRRRFLVGGQFGAALGMLHETFTACFVMGPQGAPRGGARGDRPLATRIARHSAPSASESLAVAERASARSRSFVPTSSSGGATSKGYSAAILYSFSLGCLRFPAPRVGLGPLEGPEGASHP